MSVAASATATFLWFGTRAVDFENGTNTGAQLEFLDDSSDFATRSLSGGTYDFTGSEWQQFLAFSATQADLDAFNAGNENAIDLSNGVDTAAAGQVDTTGDLRVGDGITAQNIADLSGGRLVDTSGLLDDSDDAVAITGLGKANASRLDRATMDAADAGNRVAFSNDLGFGLIGGSGFDPGGNAQRLNDGESIDFEIKQGKVLLKASFTVKVLNGASTTVVLDSDGATLRDTNGDAAGGIVQDASAGELTLGVLAHGTKVTIDYVNQAILLDGATPFAGDAAGFFAAFTEGGSKHLTLGSLLGEQTGWSADDLVLVTDVAIGAPTNQAPLAQGFAGGSGDEDTAIAGQVNATDPDGDTLAYAIALGDGPAHGSATVDAATGAFLYTPDPDFNGSDSFVVTISDGQGGSATQVVNLTVTPVNDDPTVSGATSGTGAEDTAITGDLDADDVDGDTPVFSILTGAANGTASIDATTGAWEYIPAADFHGADSFVVLVEDGNGGSATQVVNLTITPVNDDPTISGDTAGAGDEDTAITGDLDAEDVDGDTPVFSILTGAANGTASIDAATGSWEYTPAANFHGADSFVVLVEDGQGGSATQLVNLTVTPVNDAARITGTIDGAVAEDGVLVAGGTLTVEDPDAGEARFAVPASLAGLYGSFTFDAATGAWVYTLDNAAAAVQALLAAESRTDTLSVASLDGTASEVITVTIAGADDGPRIEAAAFGVGPSSGISSVSLVSGTADGVVGNGQSFGGVVSPDGTRVLFESRASNLVAGDTNNQQDVFLHDLATGAVTLVSSTAGGVAGNGQSFGAVFSPDGTRVLFSSSASNLVAGDTNGAQDLFVKDLATGAVTLVSTTATGALGNSSSSSGVFSPDGTRVLFSSNASNLVAGDTFSFTDVFVKDLTTGAVTLVSANAAGTVGNFVSGSGAVFSPDGTRVLFASSASNLVAGDMNGAQDVFVKELVTGAVILVSGTASGGVGNQNSFVRGFSPDGTRVLFQSSASNLVPGDTNGRSDLFLKDLATGAVTLVSSAAAGTLGNGDSFDGVFSPDGTRVLFSSNASNLVAGDTLSFTDVFVKDLATGSVTLVSSTAAGAVGNRSSFGGVFSTDGTRVLFTSDASNLVPGDTNGTRDLFVKDLTTGDVERLSTDPRGFAGGGSLVSVSGDLVLFSSAGGTYVPGDTNNTTDLFLTTLSAPRQELLLDARTISLGATVLNDGLSPVTLTVDWTGDGVADESRPLAVGATSASFSRRFDDQADVTITLQATDALGNTAASTLRVLAASDVERVTAVSASAAGATGNAPTSGGMFSPDGTRVLFQSAASNLVAGDTNGTLDVFVKDLATGAVTLVSSTAGGTVGNSSSGGGVFSPDSTRVLFSSNASNLVAGDTNGRSDLFVKDLATGAATLVSTTAAGELANGSSSNGGFSHDGTTVLFSSIASNLVAGDTNGATDLFVKDLATGAVTLVSSSAAGAVGNIGSSFGGVFSPDGTRVLFQSESFNLVAGDTNFSPDLFVKDLATGAVTLVSGTADGVVGTFESGGGVFSPDGMRVLFESFAPNLVDGDTNDATDLFVKDLATGAVTLVSSTAAGGPANGWSSRGVFSPDGTRVLFQSDASNLVAGDTNGTTDLFLKDLVTGAVTLVSTTAAGGLANSFSLGGMFSPDGTRVLFQSLASNLVAGDTNGAWDLFVKDLAAGAVTLVSTAVAGGLANSSSLDGVFSPDGTRVLFTSSASNLVAGDTNSQQDVFVATLVLAGANLAGDARNEALLGEDGNDTLDGGGGGDLLRAGLGDDVLTGGAGDDILEGGGGADTLTGGPGADIFAFNAPGDLDDRVTDFTPGEDLLDLTALHGGTLAFDATNGAALSAAYSVSVFQDGGETIVIADLDGDPATAEFRLTLTGTHALTAADFLL